MNLQHIRTERCPKCRATIIVNETVDYDPLRGEIRTHAHGGHWETRVFACGFSIHWAPNFGHEEERSECKMDAAYAKKQQARETARRAVEDFIDTLQVDAGYKDHLKRFL
jgi:hypothetical protein